MYTFSTKCFGCFSRFVGKWRRQILLLLLLAVTCRIFLRELRKGDR